MRAGITSLVLVAVIQIAPATAHAVDFLTPDQAIVNSGRVQFEKNCARCHGADATGGTADTKVETVKAPDLTGLAKKSGGTLPLWEVYEVVSGSKVLAEHRTRAMPIWSEELAKARGINKENKEAIVRGRILAILAYLSTIQEK
ncbi:MAG: c-type cytochrome [Gammaproteobacteria bacterium]|nr:c-type cytochrome [Gammaproteobacteria bacterium]